MEQVAIRIIGTKGNKELSPKSFDIAEIIQVLSNIEPILYPNKKSNRPIISYKMEEGSVYNIFSVTAQAKAIFTAVLTLVSNTQSIDNLELPTAKAIEQFQLLAQKNNYNLEFSSIGESSPYLTITPQTNYFRTTSLWVDAELYFYGILTNAGGKDKPNIHLETNDYGTLIISIDKDTLKNSNDNLLYKRYGIHAIGKQNIITGEIDKSSLSFVELINYSSIYNESYLNSLIARVGSKFNGLDVNDYIRQIRGSYE